MTTPEKKKALRLDWERIMPVSHTKEETFYGCDQDWFPSIWQRRAGCGPCAASNILVYLHRTDQIHLPIRVQTKDDFALLMDRVWHHVTPRKRGLYKIDFFHEGVLAYLNTVDERNIQGHMLFIDQDPMDRVGLSELTQFIQKGLENNCPVAFLNLSSGSIEHLDDWHWMTVIGMEQDEKNGNVNITVYDNTKEVIFDLREWNQSTDKGGGFVYFTIPKD